MVRILFVSEAMFAGNSGADDEAYDVVPKRMPEETERPDRVQDLAVGANRKGVLLTGRRSAAVRRPAVPSRKPRVQQHVLHTWLDDRQLLVDTLQERALQRRVRAHVSGGESEDEQRSKGEQQSETEGHLRS